MNKYFKIFITLSALLIVAGCQKQPSIVTVSLQPEVPAVINKATSTKSSTKTATSIKNTPAPVATSTLKQEIEIPSQFELKVAFVQQAPFGNWDAVHEETCEEASMIMAKKYFSQQPLNETIGEQELQDILAWEAERNYQIDLTAAETVQVLRDYYGLSAHLSRDVSIDRIKYEIFSGRLVIIPAAGRLLGNPNFKGAGPIYHMLLVKGYNDSEFITNDPGTRKGNGFKYSYQTLINAIHDWNPQLAAVPGGMSNENMAKGEKVIVIVDGLTK